MVGISRKDYERLLITEENYFYKSHAYNEKCAEVAQLKKEIAFHKMRETSVQRKSRKQLEPSIYARRKIAGRVVISEISGIRYGEY
ncbi:hypothetical protein [Lactococcus lactis]|uniref:hypothetical protein n=1 Tax=Lactococcus lactis TaxID=1358 RepID=UPI001F5A1E50|nr:hypothetical protein [Lactococcus lactis]